MYRIFVFDDEKINLMEKNSDFSLKEWKDSELIFSKETEKTNEFYQTVYTELKKSMCENVENLDYVMRLYDAFCDAAILQNLTSGTIRRSCFDLASTVYFTYIYSLGGITEDSLDELMKKLVFANGTDACEITRKFLLKMYGKDKKSMHDIISKVIRYIDEHLVEHISVASIAVEFYITPNYLSRLFKKIMGEGCNEYIVRKRLEKAQYLLETTNMKTGKIACMVGYRDTNYFSLAFKKHIGKSPTKYREEKRKV